MAQISDQVNVAVGAIHNDLKPAREAWRESSARDFDELRTVELLKIEKIGREAWAAARDQLRSANCEGGTRQLEAILP